MKNLVVALLLLTCFASPVSAGCAWVLWSVQLGTGGTAYFEPVVGFENKTDCDLELNKWPKVREGMKVPILTAKCLPDTIDPRGPKGQ